MSLRGYYVNNPSLNGAFFLPTFHTFNSVNNFNAISNGSDRLSRQMLFKSGMFFLEASLQKFENVLNLTLN